MTRTINKIKKNCSNCDKVIFVWPFRANGNNFCSRICNGTYLRGRSKPHHKLYKGDEASYTAKHARIYRILGKATKCSNVDCKEESFTFHWANLSGKYLHKKSDWVELCVICHKAFDMGKIKLSDAKR